MAASAERLILIFGNVTSDRHVKMHMRYFLLRAIESQGMARKAMLK